MPVPSFLASFADKAQSAINASPLAAQQPANDAAAQGGYKSHTLGAIQHQLRAFGQQYATTTPVQKIITTEKGVAIDFDGVARDSKSQSKELYTWGQNEPDDLKDVTDRLAYLNFVQGSLASSLALKLDAARAPLKALRDAEASIAPRRNIRAGLHTQLARFEHDQQKGMERKIAELKDQIAKAELDDEAQEKEIELLKRKAVRESEQLKWEAMREYGEKLVLLSQASTPIIDALPTLPPSQSNPYKGAHVTGAARASLQRALDNYKTGHINLPPQLTGADLHRSDTRSFGESHASELSSITPDIVPATQHSIPLTPPPSSQPLSQYPPPAQHPPPVASSPPINPSALNQSPVVLPINIPAAESPASPTVIPPDAPTIAETGIPVVAGAAGPGPASGSLHDIKAASIDAGPRSGGLPGNEPPAPGYGQQDAAPKHESAEEEKKRLQAAYSQTPASNFESAEDEKKRIEREERERLLRAGASSSDPAKKGGDDDLPPYQDL